MEMETFSGKWNLFTAFQLRCERALYPAKPIVGFFSSSETSFWKYNSYRMLFFFFFFLDRKSGWKRWGWEPVGEEIDISRLYLRFPMLYCQVSRQPTENGAACRDTEVAPDSVITVSLFQECLLQMKITLCSPLSFPSSLVQAQKLLCLPVTWPAAAFLTASRVGSLFTHLLLFKRAALLYCTFLFLADLAHTFILKLYCKIF